MYGVELNKLQNYVCNLQGYMQSRGDRSIYNYGRLGFLLSHGCINCRMYQSKKQSRLVIPKAVTSNIDTNQ